MPVRNARLLNFETSTMIGCLSLPIGLRFSAGRPGHEVADSSRLFLILPLHHGDWRHVVRGGMTMSR
jgi:hypothetical protein